MPECWLCSLAMPNMLVGGAPLSWQCHLQGWLQRVRLLKQNKLEIRILKKISGEVRPGRLTLLLGPPSSGAPPTQALWPMPHLQHRQYFVGFCACVVECPPLLSQHLAVCMLRALVVQTVRGRLWSSSGLPQACCQPCMGSWACPCASQCLAVSGVWDLRSCGLPLNSERTAMGLV